MCAVTPDPGGFVTDSEVDAARAPRRYHSSHKETESNSGRERSRREQNHKAQTVYLSQFNSSPSKSSRSSTTSSQAMKRSDKRSHPIMYNVKDYKKQQQLPLQAETDDEGIMSEVETSATGFTRGSRVRASLPVMGGRSSYSTLQGNSSTQQQQQRLGLVFLTYNDETRKTVLPKELGSLDIIKGLFLKAFPHLTFEYVNSSSRRVYILERSSGRFFVLVNFRDIKDGTMLKLVDMTSVLSSQRSRTAPLPKSSLANDSSYYSESELGSTGGGYHSRSAHHPGSSHRQDRAQRPSEQDQHRVHRPSAVRQPQSITETSIDDDPLGATPYNSLPGKRARSAMAFESGGQYKDYDFGRSLNRRRRYSSLARHSSISSLSSDQSVTSLTSDHGAFTGYRAGSSSSYHSSLDHSALDEWGSVPRSSSMYSYGTSVDDLETSSVCSTPDPQTRERMAKMEAQIANLTAWVQTSRPNSVMSDRESAVSVSASSSLSGISSSTPKQEVSAEMKVRLRRVSSQAKEMQQDMRRLRRIHQAHVDSMQDAFKDTMTKFMAVVRNVPGAENYPVRLKRDEANKQLAEHKESYSGLEKDLLNLETIVEEMRNDLVTRRALVSMEDVERIAAKLNSITKHTTKVKAEFLQLHNALNSVMKSELEIVIDEEKYLKQEPEKMDETIAKCRQLSQTVFTLKRLASVQDHRPAQIPVMDRQPYSEKDKKALISAIKTVRPNHSDRVDSIKDAESLIEKRRNLQNETYTGTAEGNLQESNANIKQSENIGAPPQDEGVQELLEEAKSKVGAEKTVVLRPKTGNGPRSSRIMNRDSVNWDDEDAAGLDQSNDDNEFVDITEERVAPASGSSAFKPVSKSNSFNGHSNGRKDYYNRQTHNGNRVYYSNGGRPNSSAGNYKSMSGSTSYYQVSDNKRSPPRPHSATQDRSHPTNQDRPHSANQERMEEEKRQRLQEQYNKLQRLRQAYNHQDGDTPKKQKPAIPQKPVFAKRHTPTKPNSAVVAALKDTDLTKSTTV